MISFKQFLSESKMRQGLPHFKDLKPQDILSLIRPGKVKGEITEKTDGNAFGMGWDKDGFFTQSARSEKNRSPTGYSDFNREQGKESAFSHHYDQMHQSLQNNPQLQEYLRQLHHKSGGESVMIKGEMFWKPLGEKTDKGVRFVGTHYDPTKMGEHGSFIMHSNLPENSMHDPEQIKSLSDSNIRFDHDKIPNSNLNIDVSDELSRFNQLDHEKMNSRKKDDQEEKELNKRKFQAIKDSIENKIRNHINSKIKPKFGDETEGHVIHPSDPNAPRFKLTSDSFAAFKADEKRNKK